nr:hypothetical protein [Pseudonocardia alni]
MAGELLGRGSGRTGPVEVAHRAVAPAAHTPGRRAREPRTGAADRTTDRAVPDGVEVVALAVTRLVLSDLDETVEAAHDPGAGRTVERRPLGRLREGFRDATQQRLGGRLVQPEPRDRLDHLLDHLPQQRPQADPGGGEDGRDEDRTEQRRDQLDDGREGHRGHHDQHDLALLDVRRGVLRRLAELVGTLGHLGETGGVVLTEELRVRGPGVAAQDVVEVGPGPPRVERGLLQCRGEVGPGAAQRPQVALVALRPLHPEGDLEELLEGVGQLGRPTLSCHRRIPSFLVPPML